MSAPRDLDLATLARKQPPPPRRRRWLSLGLPAAIVVSFVAILLVSLEGVWLGSTEVTIVRPRPADNTTTATRRVLFQAAGWVEPDPYPLAVAPLTDGVVEEVLVQEADAVSRGEVVARLLATDAELELRAAEAALDVANAAGERARVELEFARQDFEEAVGLKQRLDVAAAALAARRAEAQQYSEAAKRIAAEVDAARSELVVQQHLQTEGAAGPRQVELAKARLEAAIATQAEAAARAERARADEREAEAIELATQRDRDLRIDDRRRVAVAEAEVARTAAAIAEAETRQSIARLRLDRMEVRSPWDGVVLERLAVPGSHASQQHTAIVHLYDPRQLRVRVDVQFEQVDSTHVGQQVEILCDTRPGRPYLGTVSRRVHRADIQKVTLEVQVRIDDPDDHVRPDMLCQVRFLGDSSVDDTDSAPPDSIVLVPTRLLVGGDRLWVIDPSTRHASLRAVEVGDADGEWIAIRSGVDLTTSLIDEGRHALKEGDAVHLSGEP